MESVLKTSIIKIVFIWHYYYIAEFTEIISIDTQIMNLTSVKLRWSQRSMSFKLQLMNSLFFIDFVKSLSENNDQ